jgi:hypothetical protein
MQAVNCTAANIHTSAVFVKQQPINTLHSDIISTGYCDEMYGGDVIVHVQINQTHV